MILTINQEQLLKATDLIARAADKHHRFAILSNIKFELSPNQLILTASDLEVELSTTLKLADEACVEAGSTTLPAGKFLEICKSLNKDNIVKISLLDEHRCQITSGKSRFTLTTLPAADFPSIGTPEQPMSVEVMRHELYEMIARTKFCIATQDVRHYLTGMLFDIDQNLITTVATDGHRLAVAKRALDDEYPASQIIVPGKAVGEMERLFAELGKKLGDGDKITLNIDGEFLQVVLKFGDKTDSGQVGDDLTVSLTARLIEGTFPDYKRVLPQDGDKIAIFKKDILMDALRRVSILSNEKLRGVAFNFGGDSVTINTHGNDSGEAIETITVNYSGDPIELSINEQYLKAVVGVLNHDIKIQMKEPTTPTLITQVGDELHKYVIMPMRI